MYFVYSDNLSEVRTLVEHQARLAGLSDERLADLVTAVGEITANTVQHAQSQGSIGIWTKADEIVCEIRDKGVITNPLAGRGPRPADSNGGYGRWLVYQVCDRVELNSDGDGTVIRLHMSLRRGCRRRRLPR
jgi:anti-sigma regulatory factor (Ser/Thr protein kinase)